MKRIKHLKQFTIIFIAAFSFLVAACSTQSDSSVTETATPPPVVVETTDSDDTGASAGYPDASVASDGSGYVPESADDQELLDTPPSANIDAPQPSSGGAVYGILVQEVSDEGFLPLLPRSFYLAEVVLNSEGEPALIRRNVDSPKAELFQTGVFVFNNVPPGEYGLIVDLGFSELTINDETADPIIIMVEEGKTQNLEQVFVELP